MHKKNWENITRGDENSVTMIVTVPELHLFPERAYNLVSYLVHRRIAVLAARRLCPALVQFRSQPRDLVT